MNPVHLVLENGVKNRKNILKLEYSQVAWILTGSSTGINNIMNFELFKFELLTKTLKQ